MEYFMGETFNKEKNKPYKKLDAAEKAADYKKLQTILAEEAASAFIQVPANTTAFNKNLAGYKFYPIYVQDMSTVYFVK